MQNKKHEDLEGETKLKQLMDKFKHAQDNVEELKVIFDPYINV